MSKTASMFGTDGVRGPAGEGMLTAEECLRLGAALVAMLGGEVRVGLARDTRRSGPVLCASVAAGIQAAGGVAVDLGVLPTPGLALAVESDPEMAAGVMVTASHNPWRDNGLKLFGSDGHKISDEQQARLEEIYLEARQGDRVPLAGRSPGRLENEASRATENYVRRLLAGARERLDGRTIVVDHAAGAAHTVLPRLLRELGAEVVLVAPEPDGCNINEGVGAVHPEAAATRVREVGAWAGVVVDGDGDRIYLIDELGEIHDGDAVVGALAAAMQDEGSLRGDVVVGTITTGAGLERFLTERGLRLHRTPVGDRFVAAGMEEQDSNLGGESSGHVLTPDLCPSGDGSRVAVDLLGRVAAAGNPLSMVLGVVPRFPIARHKVAAGSRPPLESLTELQSVLAAATEELREVGGRHLLRYSGTEPVLRVQVEGMDADLVEAWAQRIAQAAQGAIEAVS